MALNATFSDLRQLYTRFPRVSIVGVGGKGNNVVSRIFEDGSSGAQCVAINCDNNSLEHTYSHERVLIRREAAHYTEVLSDNRPGEETIQECASLITPLLTGADVAFIIVGTADASELNTATATVNIARQIGAIAVGVAMIPSDSQRIDGPVVPNGLTRMRRSCDTLAIVDAERWAQLSEYPRVLDVDSLDQLAIDIVSGLSQALACPSAVNIEFSAFRELVTHGGIAHVGMAYSTSALRVEDATIEALRGPLLYDSIARCRGALINVRGDSSLTIEEAERAAQLLTERAGWNAPVVMGTLVDESWYDGCQVSILLTGGVYPYIPGGCRRLPLDMDEMETDGEDEGPIKLELDLDQLE
jgi:cell division protein FtsZ